ncbi:MAG: hypothetical protein ACREV5_21540 [Steroidobacter sp.]
MHSTQFIEDRSHRRAIAVERAVLIGAAVLISLPAVRGIARRWRVHHPKAECEPAIDEALKDTYPASDPPAQRYVDIPVNRR